MFLSQIRSRDPRIRNGPFLIRIGRGDFQLTKFVCGGMPQSFFFFFFSLRKVLTQVEPSCASTLAINSVTMLPHIRSPSMPDESFETPSICHTCAPPPGWIVVKGITVPPPFSAPDIILFEEDESDLAAWVCTKSYLDPTEKPLDFELCTSCLENYYFPFPPVLPKDWVCPGCKGLDRGESHAYRQCHHCSVTEEILQ